MLEPVITLQPIGKSDGTVKHFRCQEQRPYTYNLYILLK
jgi:hypothetical protein